jgi:tetratricopeptide (TPR) repeat protein
MRRVFLRGEFKAVVEDAEFSAEIQEIASDLGVIEGYLRVQDIALPDSCLFVRGMDHHLREQPRPAMRELRLAAARAQDPELASYANFWVGYEANNIGQYDEAAKTFKRLADSAGDGPGAWQLRRIWVESDFFRLASAHQLAPLGHDEERNARVAEIVRIREVLEEYLVTLAPRDRAYDSVRAYIATTSGNISTWLAQALSDPDQWRLAAASFATAGQGLWQEFGRLEAETNLGLDVDPDAYQRVVDNVMEKVAQRVEPRSKVLLFSTRLIAYCRQPNRLGAEVDAAFGDVLQATGPVNPLMRLYSQFQKRNIRIEEHNEELRKFYTRAKAQSNSS